MSKDNFIVFSYTSIDKCYIRLLPDSRHESRSSEMPICIHFYWSEGARKEYYYRLPGYKYTRTEYNKIARSTGRGKHSQGIENPYEIKKQMIQMFNQLVEKLRSAKHKHDLSYEFIKSFLCGETSKDSFLSFWEKIANSKKTTTRNSYLAARKSFIKYVGDIPGYNINASIINKWAEGMLKDGNSRTTLGVYERALRVVWKQAEKEGYMTDTEYPFGIHNGGVTIPVGRSRKKEYLSIEKMRELYNLFINKTYPNTWSTAKVHSTHQSLGLFLLQYFCNGMNLADIVDLKYDDFYFQSGKKALHFFRKKTVDRTYAEVCIPIIAPLQVILDEIASKPERNKLVYPVIRANATSDEKISKNIATFHGYIRKNMKDLAKSLNWNVYPSSTWARHSFATNLSHAGVPISYISESMGHSVSTHLITHKYIDIYPLETQFEYNMKLLPLEEKKETVTISREEYEQLLRDRDSRH